MTINCFFPFEAALALFLVISWILIGWPIMIGIMTWVGRSLPTEIETFAELKFETVFDRVNL